jgi:MFS family permease
MPPDEPRSDRLYYGWVLVGALGLTTIVSYGTTQYLFGVLLVPIQHETGWSRGALSGAFSLSFIAVGVAGIPIGRLVDRYGARALMAGGSALGAFSLVALAQVRELWQFYLLWAGGLGLAMALTFYSVSFVVVANWFQRRRGAALALLTLVGGLASPIYIPLAGLLVPTLGWRGTVVVMGLSQLAIALPLHATLVRRHPEDLGLRPDGDAEPGGRTLPGEAALGAALGRAAFWTLTLSGTLSLAAGSAVNAHQVPYMIGRGYGPVLAASMAGLLGLASLPGRFALNTISDRIAPQRLLAACIAAQALGVALLAMAGSLPLLVAYVVVYGFSFGAVSPLRASVIAQHFGRRAYGSITGAQGLAIWLGAGLGPLAAGWLYDRTGTYALALWLAVAALALSSFAVACTPHRHDPEPPVRPDEGEASLAPTR